MPESIEIKVAPHSKEAEMMVLGCMLGSINALNIAADQLDDSDFYFTEHKTIFQTLKTAYKLEKPADVHLICEELKRLDKLKAVGGAAYIMTLAQYAGTSAYIEEYVDLVKSKSVLRKMIHAAQTVEKKALDNPADVNQALDEAQNLFFTISQSTGQNSGKLLADIFNGVKSESGTPFLKELEERQLKFKEKGPEDPGITGLVTHFNDVDKMLNGFNKSNLMILAARPAMGKTALAIKFAENLCFKS
ncbi:MAG: DnaB-like helicase N-terminal domain-containing protein, partial [Parachlamydiaceae bacterium]